MLKKRKKRTSGERSVQAIWKKSRSCAGGAIGGLGNSPTSMKPQISAPAENLRFAPYGGHKALLATFAPSYRSLVMRCNGLGRILRFLKMNERTLQAETVTIK